jgi:hypothetical protein
LVDRIEVNHASLVCRRNTIKVCLLHVRNNTYSARPYRT